LYIKVFIFLFLIKLSILFLLLLFSLHLFKFLFCPYQTVQVQIFFCPNPNQRTQAVTCLQPSQPHPQHESRNKLSHLNPKCRFSATNPWPKSLPINTCKHSQKKDRKKLHKPKARIHHKLA